MSVGAGHVYTAKSLALSRNFNVDEYWGNSGVDVIDANGHKYVAYAPLNAVLMAIPYFGLQVLDLEIFLLELNLNLCFHHM